MRVQIHRFSVSNYDKNLESIDQVDKQTNKQTNKQTLHHQSVKW